MSTSNNKMEEKISLKEKQKYYVRYFEMKNRSIMLQCFAGKQNYHIANEKSCVMVVRINVSNSLVFLCLSVFVLL